MDTTANDATDRPVPPEPVVLESIASTGEVARVFRGLRELNAAMESAVNKTDRAAVLISACIDGGINRGARITGALQRLGFDKQHVGIVLTQNVGTRWRRDESGIYRNLM